MKYKIKIIIYQTGRTVFIPFVKEKGILWDSWKPLDYDGKTWISEYKMDKRERALNAIDLHYAGNHKVRLVHIEYITK